MSLNTKILLILLVTFIAVILAVGLFTTSQKSPSTNTQGENQFVQKSPSINTPEEDESDQMSPSTNTPEENQSNQISPREYSSEDRRTIDKWNLLTDHVRTQLGGSSDAIKHLAGKPRTSTEWTVEGQKLWKGIERREKEIAVLDTKDLMSQKRKDFAKQYELSLLNQGIDTRISTLGKDHSTLKIEGVLMGPPLVYKIVNDSSVISNLRKLGFKKIIFSDGYSNEWTSYIE